MRCSTVPMPDLRRSTTCAALSLPQSSFKSSHCFPVRNLNYKPTMTRASTARKLQPSLTYRRGKLVRSVRSGVRTRPYSLRSSSRFGQLHYHLRSSTSTAPRQLQMDELSVETSRDRKLWSDGMEDILIQMLYNDTLLEMLRLGKITTADHVRYAELLSCIEPKKFTRDQVKGKIKRLKRKQRQFTDLMNQTGMGWDPERKIPIASEEHWTNTIKAKPEFKQFKMAGCPKYEMLCKIFGSSVATGILHRASTDPAPDSDDERHVEAEIRWRGNIEKQPIDIDIDETPSRARNKGKQPADSIDVDEIDVSKRYKKPISASYTHPAHQRSRGGYSVELPEEEMINSRSGKRNKSNETESDARYSLHKRCMNLLDKIEPPLDPKQFTKAFDRLCDENTQKNFLALKPERRNHWAWNTK